MELDTFIEETLNNIARGVRNARSKQNSPWIAPGHVEDKPVWKAQNVEFDVAVTTSTGADGGIKILGVGSAGADHRNEHIQKIKFSIPVYFEAIGGPD